MDAILDAQMANALSQARSTDGPRVTPNQSEEEIRATATDFEAVFLAQLIEHMMGESTENSFSGGPGEGAFGSMLNEEYAKVMARAGGIGLADALAREMLAQQEAQNA
jgi:Rod binding domain-containing protein